MSHLTIELFKEKPKTKVWRVFSNHDRTELGFVLWVGKWRQYVYDTDSNNVIWSHDCLEELKNFIIKVNKEHKEERDFDKQLKKEEQEEVAKSYGV